MASSNQNQDLSRVLNELTKEIRKLTETGGRRGHSGGARKADNATDPKLIKDLNKALKESEDALDQMNKGLGKTEDSFKDLHDAHTDAIKGITSKSKANTVAHAVLLNRINKSVQAHTFLEKALKDTVKTTQDLEKHIEQTGEYLAEYSGQISAASAASLSAIKDQEKLKKALMNLNESVELSAGIQEMIAKEQWDAAANALDQEAKNAQSISNSIKKTTSGFNTFSGFVVGSGQKMSKALDLFGHGWVMELATFSGAVGEIVSGVKEAYKQFLDTGSKGFGGAFLKLSGAAIGLGISLESLTDIARHNMTLVGKMGLDGFIDSIKASKDSLMKLGLTPEEAAKTSAVLSQSAFLTGVDVKNKKALNSAQEAQINQLATLRATTGESIEALAEQTKSIIQSDDVQTAMIGMNKQQRSLMIQDINSERQRLTTMNLSNEAALEVIKTMNSIGSEKAVDRVTESTKVQAAASNLGIDSGTVQRGVRAYQMTDAQRAADPTASKDFEELAKAFSQKHGQMYGANSTFGTQQQWDTSSGMLSPQYQEMINKMGVANTTTPLTKDQVNNNKALGQENGVETGVISAISTMQKALESPLGKIILGLAGIAGLLVFNRFGGPLIKGLVSGLGKKIGLGGLGKEAEEVAEGGSRVRGKMSRADAETSWEKMTKGPAPAQEPHVPNDLNNFGKRPSRLTSLGEKIGSSTGAGGIGRLGQVASKLGKLGGITSAISTLFELGSIWTDKDTSTADKKVATTGAAGSAAGGWGGAELGAAGGAAVGTAILPVVGTAIGALVGAIGGGLVGSMTGGKVGNWLGGKMFGADDTDNSNEVAPVNGTDSPNTSDSNVVGTNTPQTTSPNTSDSNVVGTNTLQSTPTVAGMPSVTVAPSVAGSSSDDSGSNKSSKQDGPTKSENLLTEIRDGINKLILLTSQGNQIVKDSTSNDPPIPTSSQKLTTKPTLSIADALNFSF